MDEYYLQQSGSGMGSFTGIRYQKGDGFFGRLITGTVLPLIKKVLPFLGKTAMDTGVGVMKDWTNGNSFGESVRNRVRQSAEMVADKAAEKVKLLTGSGKRGRGKSPAAKSKRPKVGKSKKKIQRKRKPAIDFL